MSPAPPGDGAQGDGPRRGSGVVLGKFLPPHLGHVFLVEFARAFAADVTVVVATLAAEPIPGALRHAWMRELFPDLRVVHVTDENPQFPHEHPRFWEIWRESLLRALPAPPDYLFASEPYGAQLAAVLGAEFVVVDVARAAVPVSGSAIRRDPFTHWDHLPRCVRPYFARRVAIVGAESTGKTTLATMLAAHYGTVMVPEYARLHLEARGGQFAPSDIERIARGQIAAEDALARQASRLLVCDTDLNVTSLWSELLVGSCPPWIAAAAARRPYDLHLLTDVDVPFVADPVRYRPAARAAFHARCAELLVTQGRPHLLLRGDPEERLRAARAAVDPLLRPSDDRGP